MLGVLLIGMFVLLFVVVVLFFVFKDVGVMVLCVVLVVIGVM